MNADEIESFLSYFREKVSFARHLGLRIERIERGRTEFSLEIAEKHMNGAGTVHGGVHAAIMDSAMAVALISHHLRATTTNMNLTYLEPIAGGRIVCTGEVVHLGRRNAVAEAKLRDDNGRLLAVATASFRVVERESIDRRSEFTSTGSEGE